MVNISVAALGESSEKADSGPPERIIPDGLTAKINLNMTGNDASNVL